MIRRALIAGLFLAALALDRADTPRYVLLVRVHGVPGAEAAAVAGRMMRIVREGR